MDRIIYQKLSTQEARRLWSLPTDDLVDYLANHINESQERWSRRDPNICQYHPNCRRRNCSLRHPDLCDNWPNCTFGESCLYFHPKGKCKHGSRCNHQDSCLYIHPGDLELIERKVHILNPFMNPNLMATQNLTVPNNLPTDWKSVGSFTYNTKKRLGTGSLGTVVFEGRANGNRVAIKRLHKDDLQKGLFEREIENLRRISNDNNIVRFISMEDDNDFYYIALEACHCSLYDFVTNFHELPQFPTIRTQDPINVNDKSLNDLLNKQPFILRQIAYGVKTLHDNNLIHRDLKPHNVLLTKRNTHGEWNVLISDFGLSKKLEIGQNSVSQTSPSACVWFSPEVLAQMLSEADVKQFYTTGRPSMTKAVDIFSLGSIFYFVLTNGGHPFGADFERIMRALKGEHDISQLRGDSNKLLAHDLISKMIDKNYQRRPTIDETLNHAYFGSEEDKILHLSTVSIQHIEITEKVKEGEKKIDKIIFNKSHKLGEGSFMTLVYRGRYKGEDIAVKRLHKESFPEKLFDREVELLRECIHPNIVRLYVTETDEDFHYIALELCAGSLYDFITEPDKVPIDFKSTLSDKKFVLKQITLGIEYLHSRDIIHRDLKPHNVLISQKKPNGTFSIVVSDFGLSKKLNLGKNSLTHSNPSNSSGWFAPEIIAQSWDNMMALHFPEGKPSITKAVDIYGLGCVFYYLLTEGVHPYDPELERPINSIKGNYSLNQLKNHLSEKDTILAENCIRRMIIKEYKERVSVKNVLKHAYFWHDQDRLQIVGGEIRIVKQDGSNLGITRL